MSKLQVKIETEEDWRDLIDQSEEKLVVIDIHKDWCGVCEAIHPTMLRSFNDYDHPDQRIMFAHISSDKFSEIIQQSFPPESNISFTSEPLLALYRNKECVRLIKAADGPKLTEDIKAFIPSIVVEA